MGRIRALLLAVFVLITTGCAVSGGTLGGREKCWPEQPPRAASIWRGTLAIDESNASLSTPVGEIIPLAPGTLTWRIGQDGTGELLAGDQVAAKAGQDVTLFGGAGSDGYLVVCAVEEIHSGAE